MSLPVSRFRIPAIAVLLTFCTVAFAADHTPPAAGKATDYAAFDAHTNEHVTIAAEPFDTQEKAKFLRVEYLKYGFMPVRVVITNDSDKAINLTDARIQFMTAAGDRIPAALPEEIERRTNKISNPSSPGIKLPLPIPNIHSKPKTKDKKIDEDFDTLGFMAMAVEPHSTQSGFLFYDVNGLDEPVLKGAQLYVKMLHSADGKDLFNFNVPFDKYLAAHPQATTK